MQSHGRDTRMRGGDKHVEAGVPSAPTPSLSTASGGWREALIKPLPSLWMETWDVEGDLATQG